MNRRATINERSQRGVLLAITPILLTLIFILLTLVLDGSRLLAIRADMQSQVNAAATAAADAAQSCGGATGDIVEMRARALSAAQAVGFEGSADDLVVSAGLLQPSADRPDSLRFFQKDPVSEIRQTNSALVSYSRSEPLSRLLPSSLFDPVQLSVNAAARKEVVATLSSTGSTASIEGGLLGNLIGELTGIPSYSLDPTNLQSLESTLVGVGDLLDALGVAELSAMADEPLVDVLEAITQVVGGAASPAGTVIDDLTGAFGVSGLDASAVFEVVGDSSVADNSSFPLYDLVTSVVLNSVRAANQSAMGLVSLQLDTTESAAVNGLASAFPLLGDLDIALDLIVDEPPRIVVGPARQDEDGQWLTRVRSADISLQIGIDVALATGQLESLVSALSLGLVNVSVLEAIEIPLVVQVGGGEAELIAADCARGDSNTVNMDFLTTESGVTDISTGTIDSASGVVNPAPASVPVLELELLSLLGFSLLDINVCVDGELNVELPNQVMDQRIESYSLHCPDGECAQATAEDDPAVEGGPNAEDGPTANLSSVALDCGQDGITGTLSTVLGGLTGAIVPLLDSVTETVLSSVVSPLLSALGADLGGVSVKVIGASQERTQLIENVEL